MIEKNGKKNIYVKLIHEAYKIKVTKTMAWRYLKEV